MTQASDRQVLRDITAAGLKELGLTVPAEAADRLAAYGQLLLEKNQVMNLTAITEPRDVAALHMLETSMLPPSVPPQPLSV